MKRTGNAQHIEADLMLTRRGRPCVFWNACGNMDDEWEDGGTFPLCESCFQRQVQRRKRKRKKAA